ncbi:Oidioi.mRNA.OKI2018_I69.chr1.g680.t2.cds [Oikopleura dioica]|uniref:Oidioi.mRNA.OKI2018_I69.chr1.g680.t2.cds n=1 Tax=Oikopleura dioica TaxID=34765 RepID=A0ABN7SKK9_OIKDI|nr:Oidioi.mRNA.OKI2018_I69.chr1.g680.t2.cds [Oikopleura dioica]
MLKFYNENECKWERKKISYQRKLRKLPQKDRNKFVLDDSFWSFSKIVQEEESISGRSFCIANEIFTTEKTFVKSLRVIKEVYADPMENILSYDDSFMTRNSWKTIFQNFPAILALHEKILTDMEAVLQKGKIKGEEDLEKFLYSKYTAEIVEVYTLYMNSYDRKTEELANLQSNEKFSSFLSSQISNSKGDGRPLDALLIRPIQRLPSVLLLLKDFHRELEKAESKYSSIVEMSFDQMKLILERLNKEKGIDEGRQRMLNLATTVENFPQGLVSSDRILLETGAVQVEQDITIERSRLSKGKSRINFHLMSDMIILTKTKTKSVGLKRSKRDVENFVGLIRKDKISQIFQVNSTNNIGIYFSTHELSHQLLYFSVLSNRETLVEKLKSFEKYRVNDDFTPKSPVRARSKSFDRAALVRRSFDFQKKINLEL